jgi:hypothetical protein
MDPTPKHTVLTHSVSVDRLGGNPKINTLGSLLKIYMAEEVKYLDIVLQSYKKCTLVVVQGLLLYFHLSIYLSRIGL